MTSRNLRSQRGRRLPQKSPLLLRSLSFAVALTLFSLPALLICSPQRAHAVEQQPGFWWGTFAKPSLTDGLSLWAETQIRSHIDPTGVVQTLYRTGLLQKVGEGQELGYLYGFIQGGAFKEHRLTLQHGQRYGRALGINWSLRARIEGRFLEEIDDPAARFRYLLRAQGSTESQWAPLVWDEIFVNLTDDEWTGTRWDDRNRLFLGFRRKSDAVNLEIGYLNQLTPREDITVMEHIATLYLFF